MKSNQIAVYQTAVSKALVTASSQDASKSLTVWTTKKARRLPKVDPGKMTISEVLIAIASLQDAGYTQKEIGQQFATPVTAQRVSQLKRLHRISVANRAHIFSAIDRRELSLDIALNKFRGELDDAARREAERYLLYRAQETKKRGQISRGFNPVRDDPDGRH